MIFKEHMMNTNTSLTTYKAAATIALAAALYTAFTWAVAPFLFQTAIRGQAKVVCDKSSACGGLDASLVINRKTGKLERRMVVKFARGASPKESVALLKAINETIEAGISKAGPVTRSANAGLLPLEVRRD